MRRNTDQISFPQLLLFSLGLLAISIALTYGHGYSWSWWGNTGQASILIGVVVAIVMFVLPIWLITHRWLRLQSFYDLITYLHQMTSGLSWGQIIVISLCAGLGEELLFRGALQSWLHDLIGVYSAVVMSSLIFAILHAMTLYYFVITFLISLCFGILFYFSQSMLLVVTIHAVYDVIALGIIAKYPHWLGITQFQDQETKF